MVVCHCVTVTLKLFAQNSGDATVQIQFTFHRMIYLTIIVS